MERECVSDTRTEEENIGLSADRFKVMVYTHLRFLVCSHFLFQLWLLSVFSYFSIPISHITFSCLPSAHFLYLSMCVVIWLFVCYMSHTHTCTCSRTRTHTYTLQWLFIFVDLIVSICLSVTPLSNLPSSWQDLIDWPTHLSFFRSLTLLSNLHISIWE